MPENPVIDENCFVIPPLTGPREEPSFLGKPFVSGVTPVPALGRVFNVDDLFLPPIGEDENDDD